MKKNNLSKKTLLSCMITLGSVMASTEAMACAWYDAPCHAREAEARAAAEAKRIQDEYNRAQAEAARLAAEAQKAAEQAAALAAQQAAAAKAAAEEAIRAAAAEIQRVADQAASFATAEAVRIAAEAKKIADQSTALAAQQTAAFGATAEQATLRTLREADRVAKNAKAEADLDLKTTPKGGPFQQQYQAASRRAVRAAENANKAATEFSSAVTSQMRSPISSSEATNFAVSRLNQAGSGAQGLAVSSMQATATGLTRSASDINWAFRRTGDALDAELRRLNLPIPDVAGFVQQAAGPAVNEVKSFDAYRRAMGANFAKLDSTDLGAVWSVLRTVMKGERPSDGQMADYRAAFTDLFGDVSNGCAVCPRSYPSGVGLAVTVSTPTITGSTGLPIPVGGSVTFSLLQSTYLVSGKPLFVVGYAINAEVTTAIRPIPEVTLDVTWVAGALSTSKLPLATLSIAVSTPAVETAYGSWSGGGSVGFTTPEAVYMFLDQNERNKLFAALKNPSQGPAYVLEKANLALNELKTMVTNPAYDAGISVGLPGTSAMKLKPDGGMVLSLGGVIASF